MICVVVSVGEPWSPTIVIFGTVFLLAVDGVEHGGEAEAGAKQLLLNHRGPAGDVVVGHLGAGAEVDIALGGDVEGFARPVVDGSGGDDLLLC